MATGRSAPTILKPDGNPIPQKTSMIYLGSVLTFDGSVGAELSRRIGRARSEFDSLQRVWSHSTMSTKRKINVYLACVESTLLYSLHTSWLHQHELARLNAFQARCLRRILGIKHSYVSRVSNAAVLQRAGRGKLSDLLLQRQRGRPTTILSAWSSSSLHPLSWRRRPAAGRGAGPGRRGQQNCLSMLSRFVEILVGFFSELSTFPAEAWKAAVRKYTV